MSNATNFVSFRLFLILVAAAVLAVPALAEEGDAMASGGERHLNGHGFLPSTYVATPFVSTEFYSHTGVAMGFDVESVFRDLDGNALFDLKGDVVLASLGLAYQQNLWSRWGLGLMVSGDIRSGINADSFITEGADMSRKANVWVKYRLLRNEKSQVMLGLDWNYSKILYFTPIEFARHIDNGGELEDAPILIDTKVWTGQLVANWAYGISPGFGVRVNGAFGIYEDPFTNSVSKGSHRIGVLGEYDLRPGKTGIPLGFTLGYTQALPDDDPFTGLSGALLGFWYTGKDEFVIGLETGSMKLPVANQESEKVKAAFGLLTVRYYF